MAGRVIPFRNECLCHRHISSDRLGTGRRSAEGLFWAPIRIFGSRTGTSGLQIQHDVFYGSDGKAIRASTSCITETEWSASDLPTLRGQRTVHLEGCEFHLQTAPISASALTWLARRGFDDVPLWIHHADSLAFGCLQSGACRLIIGPGNVYQLPKALELPRAIANRFGGFNLNDASIADYVGTLTPVVFHPFLVCDAPSGLVVLRWHFRSLVIRRPNAINSRADRRGCCRQRDHGLSAGTCRSIPALHGYPPARHQADGQSTCVAQFRCRESQRVVKPTTNLR